MKKITTIGLIILSVSIISSCVNSNNQGSAIKRKEGTTGKIENAESKY